MLDKVRKALLPSTLKTELDQIEAELPPLEAEVEAARLEAADVFTKIANGAVNAPREQQHRAALGHHDELRRQVKSLRSRRRELIELLTPPSPVREKLADLKKPPALRAVEVALEEARAERLALIQGNFERKSEGDMEAFNATVRQVEDRIRALREQRAEQLEPWYDEIRAALRPMEVELAKRLQTAAREFIDTVSLFAEVSAEKPPIAPGGHGNGLEHVVNLSTLPAHQALEYAGRVLEFWVKRRDSK